MIHLALRYISGISGAAGVLYCLVHLDQAPLIYALSVVGIIVITLFFLTVAEIGAHLYEIRNHFLGTDDQWEETEEEN